MHVVKIAFRNLFGLFLICDPIIMKITEFDEKVPPPLHFVLFIASMILVEDLWFYLTHRLLHTKMFYEKIHKFHHQVSVRLNCRLK